MIESALETVSRSIVPAYEALSKFLTEEYLPGARESVACADLPNVSVMGFSGLIVDFCREIDARAIVKGLRGGNDYEYELPMAQMNSHLTGVETVFLPTDAALGYISSSLVKEVGSLGGDVSRLVPPSVHARLEARLAERRAQGAES